MTTSSVIEEVQLDQSRKDAFAETMLGILNNAAVSLMLSIGHRTGLFDAIGGMQPATSEQIARASGLSERYVREWLGAMTSGKIVEYNPKTGTFYLPREHAAWLTRASSPNNLAVAAQFIAVLGQVEDRITECFSKGGGIGYCCYPRFHEVMAQESAQTVIAVLRDSILPLAPGMIDRLEQGIDVIDVGCGSGSAIIELARQFPRSRFTGQDFSEEAIARAREEAKGLKYIRFEVADAAKPFGQDAYDLITAFDAIHDQARPDQVLSNIKKALRPNGVFLMQDIGLSSKVENNTSHPLGPFVYTISCMHCMSVSLAGSGAGLGAAWGVELAEKMLGEAGFRDVEIHRLPHDVMNAYFVVKP